MPPITRPTSTFTPRPLLPLQQSGASSRTNYFGSSNGNKKAIDTPYSPSDSNAASDGTRAPGDKINYFDWGASGATATAKAAAESHLHSLETAYDASRQALMGKYYELNSLEGLAQQATDPAHRAALLNRAGTVQREIMATYSPNELKGFDELKGNTNAFHLGKAVAGLGAVDGLIQADRHIRELNAAGEHEEAWSETLGEALKFPAEVVTLIPNKLGIAANFGLDVGLPQAADALGKELGHLTYEPIRRFVQGDSEPAPNTNFAPADFSGPNIPELFEFDPSAVSEGSPFDEIESQLGIDPSRPSGISLDDIEARLDGFGGANSFGAPEADGLASLDAPAADGMGFEEF